MVISSSNRAPRGWIALALLFSGQPDPVWEVTPEVVNELEKIWKSLGPWAGLLPQPPALGYRGCILSFNQHKEYFAFGGAVTMKSLPADVTRKDEERIFEKLLLSSAPQGMIPSTQLETW
jgi:hypothetical protein